MLSRLRKLIGGYISHLAIFAVVVATAWGIWIYKYKPASESHIIRLGNLGAFLSGLGILFLVVQVVREMDSSAKRIRNEELERTKNLCIEIDNLLEKYQEYALISSTIPNMTGQLNGLNMMGERKMKLYSLMNTLGTLQVLVDNEYYDINHVANIGFQAIKDVFERIDKDAPRYEKEWENDTTRLELKQFIELLQSALDRKSVV